MTHPVVILGATGGIGAALARRLVGQGRRVHLVARDRARLVTLAAELDCPFAAADVLDDQALQAAIQAAADGGTLGGLVHAVGSIPLMPLRRATPEAFIDAYRLNVVAAAQAIRHAQGPLAQARGSVVLFSSVAAARGFPNHAVIGAAKAAIDGLVRSLAAELAPKIRVNAVAPTLTRTPLAQALVANPAMAEGIAKAHPLQRLGEPDDVTAAAAWLLSEEASFVTGQIVAVDGGRGAIAGG
jgi:NAD(P)-dependent dehydrogenase (short-subunit alcohol dehydrogenase family)